MRIRFAAGRLLARAGRFVQSLALMVMRPRDLVDFTRNAYSSPESVAGWAERGLVDAGLSADEAALLEKLPRRGGELLLLGLGGGREAVPLASLGFDVTGVDFVPELAARAEENLRNRGLPIRVLVQDMSRLELPESRFETAWLTSGGCYSSIPTRRRRLDALARIRRSLKPGGHFVCQFLVSAEPEFRGGAESLRRAFAWLTFGNLTYEPGDRLLAGLEFAHYFRDEREIRAEFEAGGFRVLHLSLPQAGSVAGAVLEKEGFKPLIL
jgi:SAM-dependent methyltransferase